MDSLLLKATAGAAVLAALVATAEAAAGSYVPSIATPDFLLSPTLFLWVTANAIIIWLLSSSRRGGRTSDDDAASSSPAHGGEAAAHGDADSLYMSSSEYEYFSDAGSARRAADALPGASGRMAAREARAASRRADRPRVRKKPAGQDGAPGPRRAVAAAAAAREPDDERRGQETPAAAFAAAADGVDDEDVSMDSLWQSIVQRRAARPVVVQKSESWGNDELPRLQRVAETAAEARREMRKSASAVSSKTAAASASAAAPRPPPPSALRQLGWRTRDVLEAIAPDELLRRAESFIRRQHEHLRLQRQESEQRQLQLQRRLHQAPALIRV